MILLTTRRNRSSSIAETYPVGKVRPSHRSPSRRCVEMSQRSAGRWPSRRGRQGHGSGARSGAGRGTTAREPVLKPSTWTAPGDPRVVSGFDPSSSIHRLCCLVQCEDPPDDPSGRANGGDEETRTPDPLLAKEMLCRLSYVPVALTVDGRGGRFWTRTRDLCLIRAVL